MASSDDIVAALRRYWDYEAFRPLRKRIVASLMAGRSTCVVMPTGDGKSLCYQMPAAMSLGKTVIVIPPSASAAHPVLGDAGLLGDACPG